ncbi:hypothetical protein DdX_11761 [Ditylenchus destructor]|uniref:PPPDE domain-containing protein n=1 Tax=Ditylenchus destructor TaxID=166010 RepID=A0AAD4MYW9_9BILA|nr:hypothetical protein DdX_11761 [Ditylenchus destructor]
MSITSHSSTRGAEYYAEFFRKEPCSCGHRFFFVTKIDIIEVDFMNGLEKAFFTSVRLGVKLGHVASASAKSGVDVAKAAFKRTKKLLERDLGIRDIAIPSQYTEIFALLLLDLEAGPFEINDVTHDAVMVGFNCGQCHKSFTVTYEISMAGKAERFGRYIKILKEKRTFRPEISQKISLKFVREKYYETEGKYNLLRNNCKIWSRRFCSSVVEKFEAEQRAMAAERVAKMIAEEKQRCAMKKRYAMKKNDRLREARRRMEEAMEWDRAEAMSAVRYAGYQPGMPFFGRICTQLLYNGVINPWQETMRREIERMARIEMRTKKSEPRRRYPGHPIPMPSRRYYYSAMNSDHLYRCHETLYGYVEEDFSFWVV